MSDPVISTVLVRYHRTNFILIVIKIFQENEEHKETIEELSDSRMNPFMKFQKKYKDKFHNFIIVVLNILVAGYFAAATYHYSNTSKSFNFKRFKIS